MILAISLPTTTIPDGDEISVVSVDAYSSLGAKLQLHDTNSDGVYDSVCYDPTCSSALAALADGETVTDTISYTISDGNGGTDTATVSITVVGSGSGNGNTGTTNEVADVAGEVQYLSGTSDTDIFVIDGDSSDYAWSTFSEDDGTEGAVVWNTSTGDHDILYSFEQIKFNDQTINLDGSDNGSGDNGSGDNGSGSTDGSEVENVVGTVQYLSGTDGTDTFIIDGDSADYAWSTFTEDDGTEGAVVWNTSTGDHDILYSFRTNQVQ